jgi:hypothetical protein
MISRAHMIGGMTVCPASKARHFVWWQALRAAGVPIVASWIDAPFNRDHSEPSEDAWSLVGGSCAPSDHDLPILLRDSALGRTLRPDWRLCRTALGQP